MGNRQVRDLAETGTELVDQAAIVQAEEICCKNNSWNGVESMSL
jgi:hypothetical protein